MAQPNDFSKLAVDDEFASRDAHEPSEEIGYLRHRRKKPTAGWIVRIDPRQPSEKEVYAAAELLVDHFCGDKGKAELWLVNKAVRRQTAGDRTGNLVAVRMARAVRHL